MHSCVIRYLVVSAGYSYLTVGHCELKATNGITLSKTNPNTRTLTLPHVAGSVILVFLRCFEVTANS
jgi:hypothetical protein